MAGSPEEVSEECCPGEACSHVAGVEYELARTTGIPHMKVLVGEEEMAGSRIVPDAPSHSHKRPVLANEHGR